VAVRKIQSMQPENLKTLRKRLDGIRQILMAHRDAGASLPSGVAGSEREILVREFLSQVFPQPFRFGTGAIVDATGATSGQLDVVVEFPFLPSFPSPGTPERLYLADSVALAIEVKSNLGKQWQQVRRCAGKVLRLRRNWRAHEAFDSKGAQASFAETISRIPFLCVAYRGPSDPQGLRERLEATPSEERPDGLLVIESGAYSGCPLSASTAAGSSAAGFLAFANDVAWLARNVKWAAPKIGGYLEGLGDAG
jgi:hypothetical protein